MKVPAQDMLVEIEKAAGIAMGVIAQKASEMRGKHKIFLRVECQQLNVQQVEF